MLKAVLDTNVLVSGLFWRGTPYHCLVSAEAHLYQLIVSDPILAELARVLEKKFLLGKSELQDSLRLIEKLGQRVEISGKMKVVEADPSDDKFIETALAAQADYLVSGDRHLLALALYRGLPIIAPAPFLKKLLK